MARVMVERSTPNQQASTWEGLEPYAARLCARRPDRARFAALRADFETQRGEPETGGPADGDNAHRRATNPRPPRRPRSTSTTACATSWPSWPRTWAAASSEAAANSVRRGASPVMDRLAPWAERQRLVRRAEYED
ncbi:hypothetical protein [Streptomyces sp. NEAU-S77]|uniref:hypothetical protein n=1 Tax=Streptomyces sp. NEAU-S77 TaxID=3411033 RepID=UPI003B9DCE10